MQEKGRLFPGFITQKQKPKSEMVIVIHDVSQRSRASDHSCIAAEHFSSKETGTGDGDRRGMGCSPTRLFLSLVSAMSNTSSTDRRRWCRREGGGLRWSPVHHPPVHEGVSSCLTQKQLQKPHSDERTHQTQVRACWHGTT